MRLTGSLRLPSLCLISLLLIGTASCANAPRIRTLPAACSQLLPAEWEKGVPGAPLPEGLSLGDYMRFGDAQTGQLEKSNERYRSATGIIKRCEARDREALEQLSKKKKFLGIF